MDVELRRQKALAIMNNMVNAASAITHLAKAMPNGKFPRIAKLARKKRAFEILQIIATIRSAQIRNHIIVSQPIPKFRSCGPLHGTPSIIGERGPEIIIRTPQIVPLILPAPVKLARGI